MRIVADKALDAYMGIIEKLTKLNNIHSVRGLSMSAEVLGAQIVIHDSNSLDMILPNKSQRAKYGEAWWDIVSDGEVDIIAKFNKNIVNFVNDQPVDERGIALWSYGKYVKEQLPILGKMLKEDPASRRAVMTMPRHHDKIGTPPCFVSFQALIRDNRLHAIVTMRSNDIYLGFPLDIFQFGLMQHILADYLEVECGDYIHQAGSLHMYQKDTEKIVSMYGKVCDGGWGHKAYPELSDALENLEVLGNELKIVADGGKVEDFGRSICSGFNEYLEQLS